MDNLYVLTPQEYEEMILTRYSQRFILVISWDGRHVLDTQTNTYVAQDLSRKRAEEIIERCNADPSLAHYGDAII